MGPLISGKSRLVKYYNLARNMYLKFFSWKSWRTQIPKIFVGIQTTLKIRRVGLLGFVKTWSSISPLNWGVVPE